MALASGTLRFKVGASAPSASNHFARGSTPVSSSNVESMTPDHSAHETRPWSACTLAWIGSLEKNGALFPPHSIKAMQRVERVDSRLSYQTVDQQAVLIRVDIGITATRNDKMQSVRRDRAIEKMVRRACRAGARFEIGVGQGADDLCLEPRWLSVGRDGDPGREAPWIVRQRLRGGTGPRGGHT